MTTYKTKDFVFIISAGRTGTEFLGDRLLNVIPDSFSVHEPDTLSANGKRVLERIKTFGLWHMTIGKAIGNTGVRSIGQSLIREKISRAAARSQLYNLRKEYHDSISEPLIIESNSQWLYVCDELNAIWPHARIIVIIRDPRSWIRSWLNKGIRWRLYDPARLIPPGRLTPSKVGDLHWSEQWSSFGTFGRLAWEWQFFYDRLHAHVKRNRNARIFRFEDLFCGKDTTSIRELVAFAASHPQKQYNFDVPDDFLASVHNASHGSAPDWSDWHTEQALLVESICGALMAEFGYGQETGWKEKLQPKIT